MSIFVSWGKRTVESGSEMILEAFAIKILSLFALKTHSKFSFMTSAAIVVVVNLIDAELL